MASSQCNPIPIQGKQTPREDMSFGGFGASKSTSNPSSSPKQTPMNQKNKLESNNTTIKHEVLLRIPGCSVNLMEEGEVIELAKGDFNIQLISDQNVSLATIIKVGKDLQWPLTKDEPVVKLDAFHYLFTLPLKEGDALSYGVTFSQKCDKKLLDSLDAFLKDHACFSCPSKPKGYNAQNNNDIDWKDFAPTVEGYNGVLARAIAEGTGHIIRGIFICSNAYTNQVQKGGDSIINRAEEKNNKTGKIPTHSKPKNSAAKKESINDSIKRVRKLSNMTEKMSKEMLNGVGIATGSVMKPLVNSKQGRAFFSVMPGEVLLASLDSIDKIMNAAEAAERQALHATSGVAGRVVSNRYGENAGEAIEDALATAGHVAGTAWNVLKIRRAINPASTARSGVLKNTTKAAIKN